MKLRVYAEKKSKREEKKIKRLNIVINIKHTHIVGYIHVIFCLKKKPYEIVKSSKIVSYREMVLK